MLGRFYFFGIFLGLMAAWVTALVAGALAGVLLAFVGNSVEFEPNFVENTSFVVAALILVSIAYLVAGFVTARYSPGEEIFNAAATGTLLLFLAAGAFRNPLLTQFPLWFNVASLFLAVPLPLLGGRVYLHRARYA